MCAACSAAAGLTQADYIDGVTMGTGRWSKACCSTPMSKPWPGRKETREMWYFAWLLGLPLAAIFAVMNAMWLELQRDRKLAEEDDDAPEPVVIGE
jgi:cyd operon protein YbgT